MAPIERLRCWFCGDPIRNSVNKEYVPAGVHRERAVHRSCKRQAKSKESVHPI